MTDRKALAAWVLLPGHRFVWNLCLTVAMLLVIATMMLRSSAENAEQNLLDSRARAKARVLPALPDEENAAVVYRKATALLPKFNTVKNTHDPEIHTSALKPELLRSKDVQDFIAAHAPALKVAREASLIEQCNWGTDYTLGANASITYYSGLRRFARLLVLEAASLADQGDHAGAAENIRAISRMSKHCLVDSSLISSLVSLAIRGINIDAVQRIIFLYPPTRAEDVKAYREACDTQIDPWVHLLVMLDGERSLGLISLDEVAVKRRVVNYDLNMIPNVIEVPLVPWYGSDRKTLIALYNDAEVNLKARRWEFIQEDDAVRWARLQRGPTMYAQTLDPVIRRTSKSVLSTAQRQGCMVLGMAALEFRLKHGRDIKEPRELVPEILPVLPEDLLVPSRPLAMRKDDYGYLVGALPNRPTVQIQAPGLIRFYSFAWNGADDHGYTQDGATPLPRDTEIRSRYPHADDITFAIPPLNASKPTKEAAQ